MIPVGEVRRIFDLARISAPLEMCGLMFRDNSLELCFNVHPDPWHGFEIDHEQYFQKVWERNGEFPWATVHSHPNGPANLSGRDCQLLDALELVQSPMKMVIVGLKPLQIRIYSKAEGQYQVDWKWDLHAMASGI